MATLLADPRVEYEALVADFGEARYTINFHRIEDAIEREGFPLHFRLITCRPRFAWARVRKFLAFGWVLVR
jgi:hypothetical protein